MVQQHVNFICCHTSLVCLSTWKFPHSLVSSFIIQSYQNQLNFSSVIPRAPKSTLWGKLPRTNVSNLLNHKDNHVVKYEPLGWRRLLQCRALNSDETCDRTLIWDLFNYPPSMVSNKEFPPIKKIFYSTEKAHVISSQWHNISFSRKKRYSSFASPFPCG